MPKRDSGAATTKSSRRTWIIEQLIDALQGDDIFKTIDYRRKTENYIKQYMHQPLKARLVEIHRRLAPDTSDETLKRKSAESLMWEGDVKTTVNHIRFLGAQHRPDFMVLVDGIKIAVEVKRGESGAAVREGIGQSLVYAASEDFDFVVYLFVDTSKDGKIADSVGRTLESSFIKGLWDNYNIRFAVVGRV